MNDKRIVAILSLVLGMLGAGSAITNPSLSAAEIDFARDIQPIFAAHCHQCHGESLQESNYRLDVRSRALGTADFGDPPIVPGTGSESPLIQYVTGEGDVTMPPPDDAEPLAAEEIAKLVQWIDEGAKWPDALARESAVELTTDHWSFQPVRHVMPPQQAGTDPWVRNGVDAFILRKLREKGLEPSADADRITLIRRLYLVMHGMPPSSQEVARFVEDTSPDAYEKLVEEVLASRHYGERWARHWLDVVRFGESTGFEVNRDRPNAYHYRDYVIDAFNRDKSYRDFIVEQIAGDAVGVDVGTGFLVGGPYDMVKSPDVNLTLMQRQDELADFVNTTGTAFLGLTIGCARCHNHKFDPILQKDYYALQAVFAGVEHGERPMRGEAGEQVRDQLARVERELERWETTLAQLKQSAPAATDTASDLRPPVNAAVNTESFEPVVARFVRFTIHATNGSEPCLDELEVFDAADDKNIALASEGVKPTASGSLPNYEIHQLKHVNDGQYGNAHSWISDTSGRGWVQLEFPAPIAIHRICWGRDRKQQFKDRLATDYVIEVATDANQWTEVASSKTRQPYAGQPADDDFIERLMPDEQVVARRAVARLEELRVQQANLSQSIPVAYIGKFKEPGRTYRLYRGDPMAREEVAPDVLTVTGSLALSTDTPEQERRLALARWIANPENPLTARVLVNRVWHYHFGTGIVSTPSDFGANGTPPSHPELLDWLADGFMANSWSLKWLHRQILLSHTYQQSSAPRADGVAVDADSRLLWRYPPRRLEAEAIRDCVLAASGALNLQAGGPGFLLFEIDRENVHHYFPKKEFGPNEFRRMIYMTKIRQEQDEVFGVFDCPDGGQVIPDRSRSTTPLQALNLLNSQFMLQQIDMFAERIRAESGDDVTAQVRLAFELTFSREPSPAELQDAVALVRQFGLDALCRALLNSNEFLFVS